MFFTKKCELHCNIPMDIECCTKNVALKTENETQNREQWRHVFSDKFPESNASSQLANDHDTSRCMEIFEMRHY